MDESTAAENDRPRVPMGSHRRSRRRRQLLRFAAIAGGLLIGLSIVLAIFVHRGLLGISGIVAAVFVAVAMLRPSKLREWNAPDFTEESPD